MLTSWKFFQKVTIFPFRTGVNMSRPQDRTLALLSAMTDGERKFEFIKYLYERGQLNQDDLYDLLVRSIERNPRYYFEQITKSELLKYMWGRFQAYPEALARALVRVCPEIFYGNVAWVTRLIIRLQSDKRLGAELGMISVNPKNGGGAGANRLNIRVDQKLLSSIPRDVRDLDVECRFRDLLYWYSRERELGEACAQEEIDKARTEYEKEVWTLANEKMQGYFSTLYPGAVQTLRGRFFPALHVRWWLDRSSGEKYVLNTGDTGTYKTSFAPLSTRLAGAQKTLVLCAPNARNHWAQELKSYFPHLRGIGRVDVLENVRYANAIAANAEFIIVGHASLIHRSVIDALKDQPFDGFAWDECQYGKNVVGSNPAKRALGALEIIHAHLPRLKKMVANSATPWENSPEEIAALACVLRPDLFPHPQDFLRSGAYASPRFLRALFETCILDIELREVRELPEIQPKPWEDLFGACTIKMTKPQEVLYQHLLQHVPEKEDNEDSLKVINGVDGSQKVRYLLYGCDIPHVLERVPYDWPKDVDASFEDWRMSAKLVWLREQIDKAIGTSKIVVASGLYVQGVTAPVKDDEEILWIGRLLKKWYGDEVVLLLDGSVTIGDQRDALVERWRSEESCRILLVSMKTCPDSINLSVTIPKSQTLQELFIIGFALDWKPWKQFLGRFWREGLSIPIRYVCPIIKGTIDEARLELNKRKWSSLTRFRSRVPPTQEEWQEYSQDGNAALNDLIRSPQAWVSAVNNDVRGIGESSAQNYLEKDSGLGTRGETFARSFLAAQETMASGHIARHMRFVLQNGLIPGGILTDPNLILDAGCGPATLARAIELPVVGVDLNPWMIDLAKETAPRLASNAQVGKLSQLPENWSGRFRLIVSSLVLDWTALGRVGDSERLSVLSELIRVCHSHGLIWLTFNEKALDETLFQAWTQALTKAGCEISPLTGLLVPESEAKKEKPAFAFWSIVFTTNGRDIVLSDPAPFRFRFELGHVKHKHARTSRLVQLGSVEPIFYDRFVIQDPISRSPGIKDETAVRQTLLTEFTRWAKLSGKPVPVSEKAVSLFGSDWRTLTKLQERGIIALL